LFGVSGLSIVVKTLTQDGLATEAQTILE